MTDPMTGAALAALAVQLVTPYVQDAVKAGAGEAGKAIARASGTGAAALWQKLRARLSERGNEKAVARFEAEPGDAKRQGALELEIADALDADPALRTDVERLVKALGPGATVAQQHQTVSGQGAVGAQVAGSGNSITVGGHGSGA